MGDEFKKWLSREPKEVEIDGVKIKIPILGANVMHLVTKLGSNDEKKQAEGLMGLLEYVLKYNFPEIKRDEIEKIDLKVVNKIMEAIMETLQ